MFDFYGRADCGLDDPRCVAFGKQGFDFLYARLLGFFYFRDHFRPVVGDARNAVERHAMRGIRCPVNKQADEARVVLCRCIGRIRDLGVRGFGVHRKSMVRRFMSFSIVKGAEASGANILMQTDTGLIGANQQRSMEQG
jgi:hypothetical protein